MKSACRLEIVTNREINLRAYFRWISLYVYIGILPFTILLEQSSLQSPGFGEDTRRLQHDIGTLILKPTPAPSMWRYYDQLKNGSDYVSVGSMREGMLDNFDLFYPWALQMSALLQILSSSLQLIGLKLWLVIKRLQTRGLVIFLLLVSVFACLLVAALDGSLIIMHSAVRDNFLTWIEGNIAKLYLDSDFKDESVLHPYTQGLSAPYFLKRYTRYLGEDAVFTCEYKVFGCADVEPYSIKTWWRKDGVPIQVTDRFYVNVSIENIEEESPFIFQKYRISSTLIIEFLQPEDYGTYTCDYINPMPMRVNVEPYVPKNDPPYVKLRTPEPMTPHPKCHCQPTSQEKDPRPSPELRKICFSEFVLQAPPKKTKTVNMHPGGILISAASYRTVASTSDIKADVTFAENSGGKANSECCSLFIKLYWALFHFGDFIDLPLTRLHGKNNQNSTSYLVISKYNCICGHSYGLHEFTFYRDYFNSTIKQQEEIEIKHPVSVIIEPEVNGSVPLFETFRFCSSNNSDEWMCWCLEKLLVNSVYMFYTYDVYMLMAVIAVFLSVSKFRKLSANLIAKPLRKVCFLSNSEHIWQFPAVHGPPLYLNSQETIPNYDYDVYLSYSEDDTYDSEVAVYVKRLLEQSNLTVFDSVEDIMYGRLVDYESTKAIQHSGRFVIIVSQTFTDDNSKKMEFVAIQDTIVQRGSVPKDCILIIQVEHCDIVGLHSVPCIHVPTGLKDTFSLDQSSINRFSEWICTTRPIHLNKTTREKFVSRFQSSGFTVMSVIFVLLLLYLASMSPMFGQIIQWLAETKIIKVITESNSEAQETYIEVTS